MRKVTLLNNGQWFIVSYDSANKQEHYKKPFTEQTNHNSECSSRCNAWSVQTKTAAVSSRIGEGPQRSSSQPTLFFSYWEVL